MPNLPKNLDTDLTVRMATTLKVELQSTLAAHGVHSSFVIRELILAYLRKVKRLDALPVPPFELK